MKVLVKNDPRHGSDLVVGQVGVLLNTNFPGEREFSEPSTD